MLFKYKATTQEGASSDGTIDAANVDSAINALQRRGLIIVNIDPAEKGSFLKSKLTFFTGVPQGQIVILSRQLATLFDAKVSIIDALKLLSVEAENATLQDVLGQMTDDIQGGITISAAMGRHPKVFSSFYVSMIRSGEESGKLSESFNYLADYLERNFELASKVKNALVYPAFIVVSFIGVMIVMMVVVIPQLSSILSDSGQALPVTTRFIIGLSNIFVNYGIYLAVLSVVVLGLLLRYRSTDSGKELFSRLKLSTPYFGSLYRKLYLARITDNMDTMLTSGISMVRAIEITADVVENRVYRKILLETMEAVRAGSSFSDALSKYPEIPRIIVQMGKIGEETGKLGYVLSTIGRFYKRETSNSVDTLVSLIEPAMIVFLGLGVGFLLTAILGPIYSISSGI